VPGGFHQQFKFPGYAAPIRLASKLEADYIAAEASGNVTTQLTLINARRAAAGLVPYSGPQDAASVKRELFTQRGYDFYLEGKRVADFRRDPAATAGVTATGQPYFKPGIGNTGTDTCYPIPFVEPSLIRHLFEDDSIKTHEDAMRVITEHIRKQWDPAARHVFIGHAFVTPGGHAMKEEANSIDAERPLMVGGAEYVNAAHFATFDYAAFGHLHRQHAVAEEYIRYSGSLLKYSISEEHHQKGYLMIELDASGQTVSTFKTLPAEREVRTVRGTLEEILLHPINHDYVFIKLEDEFPVINPMGRIRESYPNAMHLERVVSAVPQTVTRVDDSLDRSALSPAELFEWFYRSKCKSEAPASLLDLFHEIWQESNKERGDAS
jgi:hypothetical protein